MCYLKRQLSWRKILTWCIATYLATFYHRASFFFFLFENTLSNFYFHTNYYFHTWDIHLLLAVMIFEPRAKYILSYSTIYSNQMCTCKLSKWTCVLLLLLFFGGGVSFFVGGDCFWFLLLLFLKKKILGVVCFQLFPKYKWETP